MEAFSRLGLTVSPFNAPRDDQKDQARKSLQLSLRPASLDLLQSRAISTPPNFRLPLPFMSSLAAAGVGKQDDTFAQPQQMQIQVDEALGVDKLRLEKLALQEEVKRWKGRAESLEFEVSRLEASEEQKDREFQEERIASMLRDLKWRQMALLKDEEESRKRAHGNFSSCATPRQSQRRALEMGGRPHRPIPQPSGSLDTAHSLTFEEEWDAYASAQNQLNGLQQSFNESFTALSAQKAQVSQQYQKAINSLSNKARKMRISQNTNACELPASEPEPLQIQPATQTETPDTSSQDDSDGSLYQMSPILESTELSDSDTDTGLRPPNPKSPFQQDDPAAPSDTHSGDLGLEDVNLSLHDSSDSLLQADSSKLSLGKGLRKPQNADQRCSSLSGVHWPQGYLHRTQSVGTPTKLKRLSMEFCSDSPREINNDNLVEKNPEPSPLAKHSSYGVKWQSRDSLSPEAQELMRIRSVQMEAERQRLWEAVGADPEFIKRRMKELDARESAQALMAMKLEARESLVANQEQLSELALRRSIALDRRDAELKARNEHLERSLARHHAREEEVKMLKKRVHDLERLLSMLSNPPKHRRNSHARGSIEKVRMSRSLSTSIAAHPDPQLLRA